MPHAVGFIEPAIPRRGVPQCTSQTPLETAEALLESVLEETEDADVHYKLRTALQLLVVARDDHARASETLSGADLDDDLRERLRELGYVE